jgi:modulator of FtsH protease HflK
VPIANGHAKRIRQESDAYARQIVLKAEGEVAEFLALLPQYIAAPGVTGQRMYLETLQKVLNNTSKVLVDGKAGNMLYLPLDKMTAQLQPPLAKTMISGESLVQGDLPIAGRGPIRRSYEKGESE